MKQSKNMFQQTIQKNVALNYLLYLPDDYELQPESVWPLLIYLHGAGKRGDDLEILIQKVPIPLGAPGKPQPPLIVLAPQCPLNTFWDFEFDALTALLQAVTGEYRVDQKRIYLTGISMGGFATWQLAEANPDWFAAIAPVCGGYLKKIGFPERLKALSQMPAWVFHGALDDKIPLKMAEEMVNELRCYNDQVRFTIFPDLGHNIGKTVYDNPEFYEWLLKQIKKV